MRTTRGREDKVRIKEMRKTEEREKWVQGVVTALWDELTTTRNTAGGIPVPNARALGPGGVDITGEVVALNNVLDQVEERVRNIRASLQELD